MAKAIEAGDERMGEHAIDFFGGEENKDVQQEGGNGIGLLAAGAQTDGGLARQLRPIAPSQVSQREEGFPDIGGTVVQGGRYLWTGGGNFGSMIQDKAKALLLELVCVQLF